MFLLGLFCWGGLVAYAAIQCEFGNLETFIIAAAGSGLLTYLLS